MGELGFIVFIIFLVVFVLIMRLLGAWMLRINDVIDELKGIRKDLRSLEKDYLIKVSNQTKPNEVKKSNQEIEHSKKGEFIKNAEELKAILKDDEMIIVMKKNQELKIIKKSQYESDKKLHLTKNYIVVDKN